MAQQDVQIILARQLASMLAMPIFIVDPAGTLIYYNEPAEELLGRRFEDTGEMPAEDWATIFTPRDVDGQTLPPQALPLITAVYERRPAHSDFWILGLDGVSRHIEVTAVPILGLHGRQLGGMAVFWEPDQ